MIHSDNLRNVDYSFFIYVSILHRIRQSWTLIMMKKKREEEISNMLQSYMKSLSKSELQEALLQILYDGPEWQFDRFINEYIE